MTTETQVSPAHETAGTPTPLVNFFSAAEARIDRWRQLSAVVRAWQAAPSLGNSSDALYTEAVVLFTEVAPLETFFAYPGPRLMAATEQALTELRRMLLEVGIRTRDTDQPVFPCLVTPGQRIRLLMPPVEHRIADVLEVDKRRDFVHSLPSSALRLKV